MVSLKKKTEKATLSHFIDVMSLVKAFRVT